MTKPLQEVLKEEADLEETFDQEYAFNRGANKALALVLERLREIDDAKTDFDTHSRAMSKFVKELASAK